MGCSVTILADSVAPNGSRLTTFEVEHWRAIHAEVLRHRMFSFSAASSRAIPGGRMVDYVKENPAGPLIWTTAKKGMQGGEPMDWGGVSAADQFWGYAEGVAIGVATKLDGLGAHKSISNRLLEPFAHIRCVITGNADAYANFFAQRLHWDAEPSMQQFAKWMAVAYKASTPKVLDAGEWHLPYITAEDVKASRDWSPPGLGLTRISAARCARVSYKTHDGKTPTHAEDLALYEKLVGSDPKHASPTEHQAMARKKPLSEWEPWKQGNLGPGWVQHRKMIAGECATAESFNLDERLRWYEGVDFLLEVPN